MSHLSYTGGIVDRLEIYNHGQVTSMTPERASNVTTLLIWLFISSNGLELRFFVFLLIFLIRHLLIDKMSH